MPPQSGPSTKPAAGTASAAAAPARAPEIQSVAAVGHESSPPPFRSDLSPSPQIRGCRFFVQAISLLAISVGLMVLLGWMLGSTLLTGVFHGFATMKPATAACFILAGLALWLLHDANQPLGPRRRWGRFAGAAIVVVGVLTATEYGFAVNLGIDELLFRQTLLATGVANPGRMSLAAALGFALLGWSLLLLESDRNWPRLRQATALLSAFDGLVAFVGYLYGAKTLYHVVSYSSMAAHTAVLLVLLGAASLAARPSAGIMAIVTSEFLGGLMARRVLPFALTMPMLFGWIRWQGELAGF
ncbi:MAG: hypothetical protein ACRD20_00235 [Terriglobales bacterium]